MNRHNGRAGAAKGRTASGQEQRASASFTRAEAIAIALNHMALAADPTISGCTLITPDGEVIYLSADLTQPKGQPQ